MKNKTRHLALCGLLLALALCLSWVERFIPLDLVVPLPGVKLGLANIVTLVVLYFFGPMTAFTVLVLRCILTSTFGGGPTALAFSLTGGLLAMAVMALARHLPFLSVYGVSVLGAAAHNTGQVLAAVVLLGSGYAVAYLAFLLAVSVAAGMLTGTVASLTFRALAATGQLPKKKNASVSDRLQDPENT
jgi:heptaprenyl diphosphate synthase